MLTITHEKIINVTEPANPNKVLGQDWDAEHTLGGSLEITDVDGLQAAINAKLSLAGGTMTGPLLLSGDPTQALGAVPLQFLDARIASRVFPPFVSLTGTTISSDYGAITTSGYYTAGDGGGATYLVVNTEPSVPASAKRSLAGGKWLLLAPQPYHLWQFGAKGDGVTNDSPAVNDANTVLFDRGGGALACVGGRWLLDDNIRMKRGVLFAGPYMNCGHPGAGAFLNDFTATKNTFVINPAVSIYPGGSGGCAGMIVLRKGLTRPNSLREGYDAVTAFAGTAFNWDDFTGTRQSDCYVGRNLIVGFERAINCDFSERSRIEYNFFDCTNGIRIARSGDMQHCVGNHGWPILVAHQSWVFTNQTVTNAANNGSGTVRLTIGAHTYAVGDLISVGVVGGTTEANGQRKVYAAGATTIDLADLTGTPIPFVNAYTSGGEVHCKVWYRTGIGYDLDGTVGFGVDFGQGYANFSWGYRINTRAHNCGDVSLDTFSGDFYAPARDYDSTGLFLSGECYAANINSARFAASGRKIYVATTQTTQRQITIIGARTWGSWGGVGHHLIVESGLVVWLGGSMQTGGKVYFGPGTVAGTKLVDVEMTGVVVEYDSAAYDKFSIIECVGQENRRVMSRDLAITNSTTPGRSSWAASDAGESWQDAITRSRGSLTAPTAVTSGLNLYDFVASGHDGTLPVNSVLVRDECAGAVSTGVVPSRRRHYTTTAVGVLTETFTIDKGLIFSPSLPSYLNNAAAVVAGLPVGAWYYDTTLTALRPRT